MTEVVPPSRTTTITVLSLHTHNLIHPSLLNRSRGGNVGFYVAETWKKTSFIYEDASNYYELLLQPAFYSELCLTSRPNGFSHPGPRTRSATARWRSGNAVYQQHSLPAEMGSTEKIQMIMTTHWNRTHYCRLLVKTGNSAVCSQLFKRPSITCKTAAIAKERRHKTKKNLIWLSYSHQFQTTIHSSHRKGDFYLHHAAHHCYQRR